MSLPSPANNESRVPEILTGTIIPSVIASIFVLGRLYSRAFLTRSFGQDDIWISFSWAASLAFSVLDCLLIRDGFGHHLSLQTKEQEIDSLKLSYVIRLLYQFAISTTKLGICAFYLRVFTDRQSRMIIYAVSAFVCAYVVPVEIYVAIQCRPERLGPQVVALCHKNTPDVWIFSVCNVFADVALLIFVIPRIMPLKMPQKQKIALLAVASLGVLVVVAATCRLIFAVRFNDERDKTLEIATITTWSAIEMNSGLFCASAPAIRPLIRKLTPRFLASTIDSYKDNTSRHRNLSHQVIDQNAERIELGSHTDLNTISRPGLKNNAWTSKEELPRKVWPRDTGAYGTGTHWDDSNSEEAIVEGIVKTVSIGIISTSGTLKDSLDQNNSVGKFEVV